MSYSWDPDGLFTCAEADLVREYCALQASRPGPVVAPEVGARLRAALSRPRVDTWCVPAAESIEPEWQWIDPARVLLAKDFAPWSYSESEIVGWAVEHRGDAEHWFRRAMRYQPLTVSAAPHLPQHPPVYYRIGDGNHRRLAYEALGLPVVLAKVHQGSKEWWEVRSLTQQWWVMVLWRLGLVESPQIVEEAGCKDLLWFRDPTGCVPWIMPDEMFWQVRRSRKLGDRLASQVAECEQVIGPVPAQWHDRLRDPHWWDRELAFVRSDPDAAGAWAEVELSKLAAAS